MNIDQSIIDLYKQLINNITDENHIRSSISTSNDENSNSNTKDNTLNDQCNTNVTIIEENLIKDSQNINICNNNDKTNEDIIEIPNVHMKNKSNLLTINQIDIDIDFQWKLRAIVIFKHPKRTYINLNGRGEVTTWDLFDNTGSINLVAFNFESYLLTNKLVEGKSYEFSALSIRSVDDTYKKLPHPFQLIATKITNVVEINLTFEYKLDYNFTHLSQIESLQLNSIIDVDVKILRDYGITTGNTNNNSWTRREVHVAQDDVHIKLTLWNEQARKLPVNVINKNIKIKNVKIDWFNGLRILITMDNTRIMVD